MSKYPIVLTLTKLRILGAAYLEREGLTGNNLKFIRDFIEYVEFAEKQRIWDRKEKDKEYRLNRKRNRKNLD